GSGELRGSGLRRAGVAVAGEVEKIQGGESGERIGTVSDRSPLPTPRYFVDVHRPRLPGRRRHFGNAPPHQRVQQGRLAHVGAAQKRDFGKRGIEHGVGAGEGADEAGNGSLGQASFLWRGRSVTSNGVRPSVTVSAVMATSRTSSRLGRSNMMSVIISSRMARRPRAPVPRFSALRAISRSA